MTVMHFGHETEIPGLRNQDVGGASLPFIHYEGGPQHIMFVHATGFLPWLWHPVIRGFVPQRSCWAPFFCDYRSSDPHEGGLSWDMLSRDLAAFCRTLEIVNPLLVGHSMGATVSALASAKHGLETCGMVLIEPIFLPESLYSGKVSVKEHPLASKAIRRTNHWRSENEAWAYLKSKPLFSGWDDEVLRLYLMYGFRKREKGGLMLACPPKTEASIFIGGLAVDPWPYLQKITCPVMVVEGEKTENRGFVDIQKILSALPDSMYAQVADAGHLIPMQKPSQVIKIIKEFFLKIKGRA